jgi:hypothetical protein
MLNSIGEHAVVTSPGKPSWNEPLFDNNILDDDIFIYPEIICGNPYNAKKVVRYMLYYPWHHFGNGRIPKHELLIPHNKWVYWDSITNCDYPLPEEHILEITIAEPHLFYLDASVKKDINTYWVSKCDPTLVERFPLPKGCVHIHHGHSRENVAALLRKTKYFFSFDVNTSMMNEAYLCGAEVFLITNDRRVIPWKGTSWLENKQQYEDLEMIRRFAELAKGFDYSR